MKSKIIFLFFIATVLFSSCDKDFLEKEPTDAASSDVIVKNVTNARILLNGIHRSMYIRYESQQVGGGIGAQFIGNDAMGEDLVSHVEQGFNGYYKWLSHRDETNFYARYPWIFYYHLISNANILINGIDAAEGDISDKNEIKGQALIYRAFAHYQLVQLYGSRYRAGETNSQLGVPYKVSVPSSTNPADLYPSRATVEEVYTKVNADIDNAMALLDLSRTNKSHINLSVAQGLKARVALTQGKWSEAATFAVQARSGYTLMNEATYFNGFRTNSESNSEFMWASQLTQLDQSDTFANFGAYMSRNFSSSAIRTNPRSINSKLYDLISNTDVRKKLWAPTGVHTFPAGVSLLSTHQRKPYTNQKFLSVDNGDSRVDVPLMRAAEMYLIEAESKARLGDNAGAAQALYNLKVTRDPSYTLSSNTGQALIDEILIDRRIELWGEGFRFLDLKRLNAPLDRTGANHIGALINNVFNVPAGDIQWQYLIPREEMTANPNMVQNPR